MTGLSEPGTGLAMLSFEANDGLNVNNGVHQCMQGGFDSFRMQR